MSGRRRVDLDEVRAIGSEADERLRRRRAFVDAEADRERLAAIVESDRSKAILADRVERFAASQGLTPNDLSIDDVPHEISALHRELIEAAIECGLNAERRAVDDNRERVVFEVAFERKWSTHDAARIVEVELLLQRGAQRAAVRALALDSTAIAEEYGATHGRAKRRRSSIASDLDNAISACKAEIALRSKERVRLGAVEQMSQQMALDELKARSTRLVKMRRDRET